MIFHETKIAIYISMQLLHLIGIVMFYVMIKIRILRKVNQSLDRYHECNKCIVISIGCILLFSSCYIYIYTSLAILLPKYKFFCYSTPTSEWVYSSVILETLLRIHYHACKNELLQEATASHNNTTNIIIIIWRFQRTTIKSF